MRLREPALSAASPTGPISSPADLTGFGFEAARWLVAAGRRLDRACSAAAAPIRREAAERVAELQAAGAEVRVYSADVADRGVAGGGARTNPAEQAAVARYRARRLGDRRLRSRARSMKARRPRFCGRSSGGAVLLDHLTRDDPIELFVLFSSATTLLGAPGQGVYVAANLALEALARRRRALRAGRRSRSPGGRSRMPAIWPSGRKPAMRWRAGSARSRCRRRKPLPALPALVARAVCRSSRWPKPAGARPGASCRSSRRRCSPKSAPKAVRLPSGRLADRALGRPGRRRGARVAEDGGRRRGGEYPAPAGRAGSTRCGRCRRWAWIR